MDNSVVVVEGLYKKFCKNLKQSMRYGMNQFFKSMLGLPQGLVRLHSNDFWALQDIHFSVKEGDFLFVLGKNGCGKSTLLRLLAGVLPPDCGSIRITGKTMLLSVLGLGFHLLLSGRENIYINGALLGMSRESIKKSLDAIIEFAGIKDFIDIPIGRYSTGMSMRLGMSIALHAGPDIFLLDEVLVGGDQPFKNKILFKLSQMRKTKKIKAVIFVTHDLKQLSYLCNKVLILDQGRMVYSGEKKMGLVTYDRMIHKKFFQTCQLSLKKQIKDRACIKNEQGDKVDSIYSGDDLVYEFIWCEKEVQDIEFILNKEPDVIFFRKKFAQKLVYGQKLSLKIQRFNLMVGIYFGLLRTNRGLVIEASKVFFQVKANSFGVFSLLTAKVDFSLRKIEESIEKKYHSC